jgi:hypothetical protein
VAKGLAPEQIVAVYEQIPHVEQLLHDPYRIQVLADILRVIAPAQAAVIWHQAFAGLGGSGSANAPAAPVLPVVYLNLGSAVARTNLIYETQVFRNLAVLDYGFPAQTFTNDIGQEIASSITSQAPRNDTVTAPNDDSDKLGPVLPFTLEMTVAAMFIPSILGKPAKGKQGVPFTSPGLLRQPVALLYGKQKQPFIVPKPPDDASGPSGAGKGTGPDSGPGGTPAILPNPKFPQGGWPMPADLEPEFNPEEGV